MPKLKTNKSARKRFKITKSGKVKSQRSGKSHLLTGKNTKRKRRLRSAKIRESSKTKTIKRFLPYG